AGNGALAKLSLFVNIGVKFIRIARQIRVIADYRGIVLDAPGPRPGNNGLQLAYFAIAEGIRRLAKIIREPARKWQLIERMDPVRPEVVELPVSVGITLLQSVVGSHAQIEGNDVGLNVRKMIEHIRQADRLSVHGKGVARNVVAASHGFKGCGVRCSDRAELRMAIRAWGTGINHIKVVDHPAFVPAALIVDNE